MEKEVAPVVQDPLYAAAVGAVQVGGSCGGRRRKYDMVGERYGWLVIEEELPPERVGRNTYRMALCRCGCGRMKVSRYAELRRGGVTSCGCLGRLRRPSLLRKSSH